MLSKSFSDRTTKKTAISPTSSVPPKSSDFTPAEKEGPEQGENVQTKDAAVNHFPGSVNKLQKLQERKQEAVSKVKLSTQQVRENVRGYMFTRFFDYVKNYDTVLEKNFPSAVKVYRVFFDGVKEFFTDMKRFLKITRIVNSSEKGIRTLNRQELELYMQMPRDMVKVAPTIIFSSLPMVGYAIFPLV